MYFKKTIWYLTKKFKILRPAYFRLIKFKNRFSKNLGYWIPYGVSITDFFNSIKDTNYICFSLSFFEDNLPKLEFNQDIDLLVDDSNLSIILSKLKRGRPNINAIRVDIYSLNGISPFDYSGMPLFPVKFGRTLLKSRILKNFVWIPNEDNQVLSTIYRALYIKDLVCNKTKPDLNSKHIKFILDKMESMKINIKFDFDSWHKYLKENDASLPIDSMNENSICMRALIKKEFKPYETSRNFAVFILRNDKYLDKIIKYTESKIKEYNFEIIFKGLLGSSKERVTDYLRGGNWNSSSVNVSSQPIYYFFIESFKSNFNYADVQIIKNEIRTYFHKNVLHSTDS
jgi:hypothetical protein